MTKVRLERPGTVSFVGDRAATPGAIADGLRSTTQEECRGSIVNETVPQAVMIITPATILCWATFDTGAAP